LATRTPAIGFERFDAFSTANRKSTRKSTSPENATEETTMIFDYSLAALVATGLMFYLTYALLKPERF
jgi:K+-transporting ATPase KdpF subunit